MDFEDERRTLETDFKTKWAGLTPVQYSNVPLTPQPTNEPWVRMNILRAKTGPASVSNRLTRSIGILNVQIFTPGDTGSASAWKYVDKVADFYNYISLPTIRGYMIFQVCDPEEYGHNDGWYQVNANVPYRRDALKDMPLRYLVDSDGNTILDSNSNPINTP